MNECRNCIPMENELLFYKECVERLKKERDDWKQASHKEIERREEERSMFFKEIQKLTTENEKLKEENEKLKEDIDGDGWLKQGYKTELSNSHKQINLWCKENNKLKRENKQLKEVFLQSHKKNI